MKRTHSPATEPTGLPQEARYLELAIGTVLRLEFAMYSFVATRLKELHLVNETPYCPEKMALLEIQERQFPISATRAIVATGGNVDLETFQRISLEVMRELFAEVPEDEIPATTKGLFAGDPEHLSVFSLIMQTKYRKLQAINEFIFPFAREIALHESPADLITHDNLHRFVWDITSYVMMSNPALAPAIIEHCEDQAEVNITTTFLQNQTSFDPNDLGPMIEMIQHHALRQLVMLLAFSNARPSATTNTVHEPKA